MIPNTDEISNIQALIDALQSGQDVPLLVQKQDIDDLYYRNEEGRTLTHMAAQHGCRQTIKAIYQRGVDVNRADHDGATPLFIAVVNADNETIDVLHDCGADVNQIDQYGANLVLIAAQQGHDKTLTMLHDRFGLDINQADEDGISPVFIAATKGYDHIITLLQDRGANLDQANNDGTTPVFVAARKGHLSTVELLVSKGADIGYLLDHPIEGVDYQASIQKGQLLFQQANEVISPPHTSTQSVGAVQMVLDGVSHDESNPSARVLGL